MATAAAKKAQDSLDVILACMQGFKDEFTTVKGNLSGLKEEMTRMKNDMVEMKTSNEAKFDSVRSCFGSIKFLLTNQRIFYSYYNQLLTSTTTAISDLKTLCDEKFETLASSSSVSIVSSQEDESDDHPSKRAKTTDEAAKQASAARISFGILDLTS